MAYATATLPEHRQALLQLLEEFDRVCKKLDIPYMLFAGTLLGAVRHRGFIPWDDDLDVILLRRDYTRFLQEAPAVLEQEKFFLQKEFSQHWPMFFSKLRLNGTTCLEKFHPKDPQCHQGVYLDIFPCDMACKTALGRRLQFCASKVVIAKSLYRRGYDTDSRKKKLMLSLCRLLPGKLFRSLALCGRADSPYVHSFFAAARSYEKNVYPAAWFRSAVLLPFEGREYPVSGDYDALLRVLYGDYMQEPSEEEKAAKQHGILVDLHRSYEEYGDYRDHMEFDVYTRSVR